MLLSFYINEPFSQKLVIFFCFIVLQLLSFLFQKLQEANAALVDEEETASASGWSPPATGQRRIEARSSEDGMTGTVRCIYFASTFIRDS